MNKKICLVTGAGGSIGRAMTNIFAKYNFIVVATDINMSGIHEKDNIFKYHLDVTNTKEIESVFDNIKNNFSVVDVLVNCAGILRSKPFENLSVEEWNQTISINLTGSFAVSRRVYEHMMNNHGGVIINISSDAGEIGSTMSSADYSASKAGVIALTKCIAREGAKYGIRSNAIAPGFVDTEMLKKFEDYWGKEKLEETVASIPLKRMAKPSEVARLAYFLASDDAAYITGATFDINGGSCMN
ncbi:MAG: SDR family oxidoreductase [Synergistes jonesii]|uniref:SDR family NAD(P)-dependent oxidoreductase n=1 Tax=Synergistes jonesii TaxID=2754 RepID=UPI002A75E743|nr:SDR family oxidoreductase [Synergistes jonesii]MDY2983971.1 SDR family oxidoreductase [Synergistes jonesii]